VVLAASPATAHLKHKKRGPAANQGMFKIANQINNFPVMVSISGPVTQNITLQPLEQATVTLPRGNYSITASIDVEPDGFPDFVSLAEPCSLGNCVQVAIFADQAGNIIVDCLGEIVAQNTSPAPGREPALLLMSLAGLFTMGGAGFLLNRHE
jgi:hypothetical protein